MGIEPLVESAAEIESFLERFEYAGYFRNLEPYGEPMLSKRDLYPTVNNFLGDESTDDFIRERFGEFADDERSFFTKLLTVLHYSDGDHTMLDIADLRGCRLDELVPIIELLEEYELLEPIYAPE
jgi:aminopeptidase-like protein